MKWRPRQQEIESGSWPSPYSYDPCRGRSAEIAEVLARLEAATRLRDTESAARLLDRLAQSDDGMWLLHQCAAAGLREVAAQIADSPATGTRPASSSTPLPSTPLPSVRSIGAA